MCQTPRYLANGMGHAIQKLFDNRCKSRRQRAEERLKLGMVEIYHIIVRGLGIFPRVGVEPIGQLSTIQKGESVLIPATTYLAMPVTVASCLAGVRLSTVNR